LNCPVAVQQPITKARPWVGRLGGGAWQLHFLQQPGETALARLPPAVDFFEDGNQVEVGKYKRSATPFASMLIQRPDVPQSVRIAIRRDFVRPGTAAHKPQRLVSLAGRGKKLIHQHGVHRS
jgi:hypothetical protein